MLFTPSTLVYSLYACENVERPLKIMLLNHIPEDIAAAPAFVVFWDRCLP